MITTPFTTAKPGELELGRGEVHLWRTDLSGSARDDEEPLDPEELTRLGRLVDPDKRRRRLNCRRFLRRLLGAYLRLPPADIRLHNGPHGRPHLDSCHGTDLNFNLSHAGSLAVVALARVRRLGIDIETVRPLKRPRGLLARCFSATEARRLQALPAAERERAFFQAWTAKEAVLKAEGAGIFHQPAAVEVTWGPVPRLLRLGGDRRRAAGWKLWEFSPAPGCVGMLALPSGRRQVRCLTAATESGPGIR